MQYAQVPWERGVHDCVLFIHKYTDEVWGKAHVDPRDYPFYNYRTALRAIRKICKDHDVENFEGLLDKYYYRVDLPVQGGIVAKPDTEGLTGYSYGICYDGFGYFVGRKGLMIYELNPKTDLYWSVE
jgi:hypothetical protein